MITCPSGFSTRRFPIIKMTRGYLAGEQGEMSRVPEQDDIEYAIRRLKRAVIDAYMLGPGSGNADYCKRYVGDGGNYAGMPSGEYYMENDPNYDAFSSDANDSRGRIFAWKCPDKNGEGGGSPWPPERNNDDRTQMFLDIRRAIEEIVDRWRHVPDPEVINDAVASADAVIGLFNTGQYRACGGPDGSIYPNLTLVSHFLMGHYGVVSADEGLQGQAVLLFKRFFMNLADAVDASRQIVYVIRGAAEAERETWRRARVSAPQLIHRVAGACERLCKGPDTDINPADALNALAITLGAASIAPGPHQLVTGAASLGLSIVSTLSFVQGDNDAEEFREFMYEIPDRRVIYNYQDALDVLSVLLNGSRSGVNADVEQEERETRNSLSAAIACIAERKRLFDPTPEPIVEVTSDTLDYDRGATDEIVSHMNLIGEYLNSAAENLSLCKSTFQGGALRRHHGIGIGSDGPSHEFDTLIGLLEGLLRELSAEAYSGAANLEAAMNYLAELDAVTQEKLLQLAQAFTDEDLSEFDSRLVPSTLPYITEQMTKRAFPGLTG